MSTDTPPRVHFHMWAAVEASRHSDYGDQLDVEACADCPTWRLRVRAARGRDLVAARAVADAVIEALNRLGAVCSRCGSRDVRTFEPYLCGPCYVDGAVSQ